MMETACSELYRRASRSTEARPPSLSPRTTSILYSYRTALHISSCPHNLLPHGTKPCTTCCPAAHGAKTNTLNDIPHNGQRLRCVHEFPHLTTLHTPTRILHGISAEGRRHDFADGKLLSPEEEGVAAAGLRQDIVAEMQRQKDFLSLFVTSDWDSYIRNMSRPGTWGGAPPRLPPQPALTGLLPFGSSPLSRADKHELHLCDVAPDLGAQCARRRCMHALVCMVARSQVWQAISQQQQSGIVAYMHACCISWMYQGGIRLRRSMEPRVRSCREPQPMHASDAL